MATRDQNDDHEGESDQSAVERRRTRNTWLAIIIAIGVASLAIRLLARYNFDHSALLYVGIPFLIALAIAAFRPLSKQTKWWHSYRDHANVALIIFLGSSIVLFEGFICVVMFMPIYFFFFTLGFAFSWFKHSRTGSRGKTYATILPVLVLASSFEGTSDWLSFERASSVTVTKTADLSPAEIMQNIAEPFDLQTERGWLISIFPMPYRIDAGSLGAGEVHRVYTRYHRWFATNTHEGEAHLEIVAVEPNRIETRFIHDSTYFSTYLTALGTEISLTEIAPGKTEISLRFDYVRKLDPAWYFHPLEQLGVGQMASLLIDEVMIRE
ncbi:MAG: hypothetical protein R3305_07950 [Gammaproteobacteria bacterium]|nr:hypothetical protein [Gammaproteobacteria bacterium]